MWQTVDAAVARQHPLHGLGGWLAFFSVLFVIGAGYSLFTAAAILTDPTEVAGLVSPMSLTVLQIQAVWTAATAVLLLVLWFGRSRAFRTVWTLVVLVSTGLGAASAWLVAQDVVARFGFTRGGDPATQAGIAVVAGLIGLLLFNWYMSASRRFRVTFHRQVRQNDPLLAQAAPSWGTSSVPSWQPPAAPQPGWGQPPPTQPPPAQPPAWGQQPAPSQWGPQPSQWQPPSQHPPAQSPSGWSQPQPPPPGGWQPPQQPPAGGWQPPQPPQAPPRGWRK